MFKFILMYNFIHMYNYIHICGIIYCYLYFWYEYSIVVVTRRSWLVVRRLLLWTMNYYIYDIKISMCKRNKNDNAPCIMISMRIMAWWHAGSSAGISPQEHRSCLLVYKLEINVVRIYTVRSTHACTIHILKY